MIQFFLKIHKNINPGIAKKVEAMKKFCQPNCAARIPAVEENNPRPIVANEIKVAYCVALNATLQRILKYATKTASPIPPLKFSAKITKYKTDGS